MLLTSTHPRSASQSQANGTSRSESAQFYNGLKQIRSLRSRGFVATAISTAGISSAIDCKGFFETSELVRDDLRLLHTRTPHLFKTLNLRRRQTRQSLLFTV